MNPPMTTVASPRSRLPKQATSARALQIQQLLWHLLAESAKTEATLLKGLIAETANKIDRLGPDRYLSEKDVAATWPGLFTIRWLQEKRRLGGGPPYLGIGRNIRYAKRDIEQWLTEQRHIE